MDKNKAKFTIDKKWDSTRVKDNFVLIMESIEVGNKNSKDNRFQQISCNSCGNIFKKSDILIIHKQTHA